MRYKLMIAVASATLMATSGIGMAAFSGDHYTGNSTSSAGGEITPQVQGVHPIDKTDQSGRETTPLTMQDAQNGQGQNGPYLSNGEGNGSRSNLGAKSEFNGRNQGVENQANEGANASMSDRQRRRARLIGRPVLDQQGQQIGNVVRALDDGLVISTGQFLGMGQHEVLLRKDHVRLNRVSGTLVIGTDLSRDQISDLPAYNAQPTRNPNALYNVPENEGSGASGRAATIGSGLSH